jgi:hypothetical protein
LQSGKKEKYTIHSASHVPAMLFLLKNELTPNLILKDGKRNMAPEETQAFASEHTGGLAKAKTEQPA